MPRDISGNYTLPVGNPVVAGTIIDVAWANPTMSDIAVQLNNVITRDGVLAATNPIKFATGTAGAPSITFSADPAMGLYRAGTNILSAATAGTERFRIDASGTTYAYRTLRVGEATVAAGGGIRVASTDGDTLLIINQTAGTGSYLNSVDSTLANARPLRIGSSTCHVKFAHNVNDVFTDRVLGVSINRISPGGIDLRHAGSASNWGLSSTSGAICNFYSDNGSAAVFAGSITVNGNVTGYNSVSDARLKTNIVPSISATKTVRKIGVRGFDWVNGGDHVSHGFIAQELNDVFPSAVSQGDTWSVDSTKLVPLLTKSLQEAWDAIDQLRGVKS